MTSGMHWRSSGRIRPARRWFDRVARRTVGCWATPLHGEIEKAARSMIERRRDADIEIMLVSDGG